MALQFSPGLSCIVGANGSGKCVDPNTEIILSDGSKRLAGEIVEKAISKAKKVDKLEDGVLTLENPENLSVHSLNPITLKLEKRPISAFVKREAPEQMLKVTTRSGREIITTPYHPFLTIKSGEVRSLKAEELETDIAIAAPRKLDILDSNINIDFPSYFSAEDQIYVPFSDDLKNYIAGFKKLGRNWRKLLTLDAGIPKLAINRLVDGQSINISSLLKIMNCDGGVQPQLIREIKGKTANILYPAIWNMTEDLSRFLGYMISEGENTPSNQMWFVNSDEEIIKDFCKVSQNCFGRAPSIFNYCSSCKDVIIFSKPICSIAEKIFGFGKEKSAFKKVPSQIFTSNRVIIQNFLAALFAGDSYIHLPSKNSRGYYIEYSTASQQLAKDVSSLLLRLGVLSNICKKLKCATNTKRKIKRAYYSVYIYGINNLKSFAKQIPLVGEKQKKLEQIKRVDLTPNPNIDLIPTATILIRRLIQKTKVPIKPTTRICSKFNAYYQQRCEPSRQGILEVLNIIGLQHNHLEEFKQLKVLAESDIYWDQIVNIQRIKPRSEWVYDLCIEDNHNFVAENIIVHNTNILDGLCFALGQLSSKSLRADNYAELIYQKKGENNGQSALVKFDIDNHNRALPVDTPTIELERHIKPCGSTQFKINSKNATRQEVIDLLARAKVNPDGHNIILQGDISRFVEMRPIERKKVLEEVAGISVYESKKEKALYELSKVDDKLKEAKIVLAEKETYLKELYSEKQEAEKYRSFKIEMERAQATEVKLKMDSLNDIRNKLLRRIQKLDLDLEEYAKVSSERKSRVEELDKAINILEQEIEKRGGEDQLVLQKSIEKLRFTVESDKNLIESSNNEIKRIDIRLNQLKKNLSEIDSKIKEAYAEQIKLKKQKEEGDSKIENFKKELGVDSTDTQHLQDNLNKLESELDNLVEQKQAAQKRIGEIDSRTDFINFKLKDTSEKLAELNKQKAVINEAKGAKGKYKQIITQLNQLANQDSKLALELGELRKQKIRIDENVGRLKSSLTATEELVKHDRAIKFIFDLNDRGVIGTVAQLGKVNSKFSTALKVIAGSRMKNIIVDSDITAIKCLERLKESKAGIVTFLPMNKIQSPPLIKIPDVAGVHGPASDLVKYEKKYDSVFKYVFGNTLVVENTSTVKALGVGKHKMVTLDGDSFQSSGAITGGYIKKDIGLGFQENEASKEFDEAKKAQKELKEKIEKLEIERDHLEEAMINIRRSKAELEGRIESIGPLSEISVENLEREEHDLQAELNLLSKEKVGTEKRIEKLDEEINKVKIQRNKINIHIKDIQFGERSSNIKKLDAQKIELDSRLATIHAQLNNAYLPEQENISRVIRELDKEKREFEKQIFSKESEMKKQAASLSKLETEEKEAYGKLKQLFSDKAKHKGERDKLFFSMNKEDINNNSWQKEKNDLAIEKAKIESQFSGLKEELAQIISSEPLSHITSVTAAKNKVRELKEKLEGMGNVNMKALEIYEDLKQEYDKISWRVSKLASEKEDIHKVIDEIEKKKKDAFMATFNKVSNNFKGIFERVTDKGSAVMVLENENDPLEGGVDVIIKHKEGKHITLASLSGGEKSLVALAIIFAIQECDPAPFYLLDEIDAALDKVNSEKVAKLLYEYSKKAQIIMISHNDALISQADRLYGVSMTQEGESKVVSLEL